MYPSIPHSFQPLIPKSSHLSSHPPSQTSYLHLPNSTFRSVSKPHLNAYFVPLILSLHRFWQPSRGWSPCVAPFRCPVEPCSPRSPPRLFEALPDPSRRPRSLPRLPSSSSNPSMYHISTNVFKFLYPEGFSCLVARREPKSRPVRHSTLDDWELPGQVSLATCLYPSSFRICAYAAENDRNPVDLGSKRMRPPRLAHRQRNSYKIERSPICLDRLSGAYLLPEVPAKERMHAAFRNLYSTVAGPHTWGDVEITAETIILERGNLKAPRVLGVNVATRLQPWWRDLGLRSDELPKVKSEGLPH